MRGERNETTGERDGAIPIVPGTARPRFQAKQDQKNGDVNHTGKRVVVRRCKMEMNEVGRRRGESVKQGNVSTMYTRWWEWTTEVVRWGQRKQ